MSRSSLTHFAVMLGTLGVASTSSADGPELSGRAAGASFPEFDELLSQLGSSSFIQQDWAARRLLQQGPQIALELADAIRETNDEAMATAAIGLLMRMSREGDSAFAASALVEMTRLHDGGDTLTETTRQKIAIHHRQAMLHILARLTAMGAEIDRDDQQRILRISIHSDQFTDRQMPLVAAFTTVKVLDLRGTPMTGNGLTHLAELVSLERLVLTDTQLTGEGLRQLPALPELRDIALYRVPLSAEDIDWLRDHLPHCRLNR